MSGVALPSARAPDADPLGLLTCVHCGLCLPACPTYQILGEENDSPRGRLYLMRASFEGREGGPGARRFHLGRCLGCRACETACPAGVPYGALLERERETLLRSRPASTRLALLALTLLTGSRLSRVVYAGLRTLRNLGLTRWVGAWGPGRLGLAARLLDATRPASLPAPAPLSAGTPARPRGAALVTPGRSAGQADRGRPAGSAENKTARTYALLEGCVMRGLFRHVHEASRSALRASGFREVRAGRQGCCGALHAHAGYMEQARELARRNVAAFERTPPDHVVANAAGCGAAMREYGDWLADDPDWAAAAERFAARVRDVTEVLRDATPLPAPLAPTLPDGDTVPEGDTLPDPPLRRIAYDAPCHLLHAQRIDSAPQVALRAGAGIELEPLPSSADCCGGAGLYNLFHPSLSDRILERKLEEIHAGAYEAVATGNPGCIMQIGAGLRAAGSPVPVVHPVELLARES